MDAEESIKSFDVDAVRADFPILQQQVNGKQLVYFDNAASSQKPLCVIEAIDRYYRTQHANIHRGVHHLSQVATAAYESARSIVAGFIHAASRREVIFTRGATEAINLVASAWGEDHIGPGDEILISAMEHHANIVPWQLLCERKGASLQVVRVNEVGEIDLDVLADKLNERTKLLAVVHVSNALGTINPVRQIHEMAHAQGVMVLLDAAQSVAHLPLNVKELDSDFVVFSGHKVFGPTGIGVLYGKEALLNSMRPYQGGGDMIETVRFEGSTFRMAPERFEAGTPHIAGAIALAEALKYFQGLDHQAVADWESQLLNYATKQLQEIDGIRIFGMAREKIGLVSFTLDGIHSSDLGTLLDMDGVAGRTGHHCTMPLWESFGISGTCRASFAFYNTLAEIDVFIESLARAKSMLS